ncbi:MAG: 8-oxo-dGTP diphosphatase [Myxococcota bacterium]
MTTTEKIDWPNWQPTMRATLVFLLRAGEVLLIHKKTGLGKGKVNAPGGKLEVGETPAQAAVREVKEEVDVDVGAVEERGTLRFQFIDGERLALHCVVFVATEFEGEPTESREAKPFWCGVDAVPYEQMWQDDQYWLPGVLEGRRFEGDFVFDDEEMLWRDIRWLADPPEPG